MKYNGSNYDPILDDDRLDKQLGRVFAVLLHGEAKTLLEIHEITGDPEASISAQIRHLRKNRFGGYIINKERRGDHKKGLFEYFLAGKKRSPLNQNTFDFAG